MMLLRRCILSPQIRAKLFYSSAASVPAAAPRDLLWRPGKHLPKLEHDATLARQPPRPRPGKSAQEQQKRESKGQPVGRPEPAVLDQLDGERAAYVRKIAEGNQTSADYLNSFVLTHQLKAPVVASELVDKKRHGKRLRVGMQLAVTSGAFCAFAESVFDAVADGVSFDGTTLLLRGSAVGDGSTATRQAARKALCRLLAKHLKDPHLYTPAASPERRRLVASMVARKRTPAIAVPVDLAEMDAAARESAARLAQWFADAESRLAPGREQPHVKRRLRVGLPPPALQLGSGALVLRQPHLPISRIAGEMLASIAGHDVTIVTAGTGSGKTTQLPQLILDNFSGGPRNVVVTQPRRIAAISIARRVAQERESRLGDEVGFVVRFDQVLPSNPDRSVVFCTSGSLLRMLHSDSSMLVANCTHIVLDEVHERDTNTDMLLLLVKKLLRDRPGLKLVLMSATMEADKLASYFAAEFRVAPVLHLDNASPHPIEESYLEDLLSSQAGGSALLGDRDVAAYVERETQASMQGVQHGMVIPTEYPDVPPGLLAGLIQRIVAEGECASVLVFLPGWDDIARMHRSLQERLRAADVAFFPVHSTVPPAEVEAMFEPVRPGSFKVVLATNIAESSLTIPDVTHVIDAGRQKCTWYDAGTGISQLLLAWASRANLRQRRGRVGRCAPGKYWSLLSRARVAALPAQTPPEMTRTGLDEVCLSLVAIHDGVGDGAQPAAAEFLSRAIDPPQPAKVQQALDELASIGAIERGPDGESLTRLGRALVSMPVGPRQGRLLLTAGMMGAWDPVCTAVAAVGERPFLPVRLPEDRILHRRWCDDAARTLASSSGADAGYYADSDHLALHAAVQAQDQLVSRSTRIHAARFSRVLRVRQQLAGQLLRPLRRTMTRFQAQQEWHNRHGGDPTLFRFLLLWAMYPRVAMPVRKDERRFARGNFALDNHSPDDANAASRVSLPMATSISTSEAGPRWLVFNEVLDLGTCSLLIDCTAVDPMHLALVCDAVDAAAGQRGGDGAHTIACRHGETPLAILHLRTEQDMQLVLQMRTVWRSLQGQLMARYNAHNGPATRPHLVALGDADDSTEQQAEGMLDALMDTLVAFLNACTDHRRAARIVRQ